MSVMLISFLSIGLYWLFGMGYHLMLKTKGVICTCWFIRPKWRWWCFYLQKDTPTLQTLFEYLTITSNRTTHVPHGPSTFQRLVYTTTYTMHCITLLSTTNWTMHCITLLSTNRTMHCITTSIYYQPAHALFSGRSCQRTQTVELV